MTTKRIIWIDALNIVACAGVLLLHCTNGQIYNFSGSSSVNWYIGLFTHGFFLWPVNVFFMISGFTILSNYADNQSNILRVKDFYKRRCARLAVPLLAWDAFYMLLRIAIVYTKGERIEPVGTLLQKFCLFEYNGFMWFFVPLILIYISLPFFAVFVLNSNRRLLRLFLIIGCVMGFFSSLFADYTGKYDFHLMGSRYLYFIVAGYYLGHYGLSEKTRKKLYVAAIISMAIISIGTYVLTLHWPEHFNYFLSYTNLPCTIAAMGVFVFFRYVNWHMLLDKLHITPESLTRFSGLSLGIYLIQMAWFTVLGYFKIGDGNLFLRFVLMYVLCVGSVYVMQKIPLIKRLVS